MSAMERADAGQTRRSARGRGLAIVRGITSLHGATVSLNVSKLGGSEVTMCFPGYDVHR